MGKEIPTAEEFMNRPFGQKLDTQTLLIEFAKLHVQKALKEASEKAEVDWFNGECRECGSNKVNEQSIINAYDLNNIK